MARQPRLFDPGPKGPDRWKLHPDNWVQDPNVVYHASGQPTLPREDRGPGDIAYGSARGMHFGDKATAVDRGLEKPHRKYVHTARLESPQFSRVMSDHAANFSEEAESHVAAGGVVRYRNDFEAPDRKDVNVSYRVLPERTKTWSEDVKADPTAHPALQYLADKGYNPTISMDEARRSIDHQRAGGNLQPQLFGADVLSGGKAVGHFVDPADAFDEADKRRKGGNPSAGVRRNNLQQGWWQSEAAANVPHRITRPQ